MRLASKCPDYLVEKKNKKAILVKNKVFFTLKIILKKLHYKKRFYKEILTSMKLMGLHHKSTS